MTFKFKSNTKERNGDKENVIY